MNHAKRLVLGIFLTTILSGQVHAQSSDTMNFRFSPIGLLAGAVSTGLDVKLNSQWTLGPEVLYWNFSHERSGSLTQDVDITAFGGGARANWFKNGVYKDGLYVGPSLSYASVEAKSKDSSGEVSATAYGVFLSGLVGYGWFWDSFNIMLGGGLSVGLGDSKITIKDSSGGREETDVRRGAAAFEFSLGWVF